MQQVFASPYTCLCLRAPVLVSRTLTAFPHQLLHLMSSQSPVDAIVQARTTLPLSTSTRPSGVPSHEEDEATAHAAAQSIVVHGNFQPTRTQHAVQSPRHVHHLSRVKVRLAPQHEQHQPIIKQVYLVLVSYHRHSVNNSRINVPRTGTIEHTTQSRHSCSYD